MSPYLFVIAMEVLCLLLEEETSINPLFEFHPRCVDLRLNHLCFADDLLIFSTASTNFVQVVKEVLGEFEALSRLRANPAKSTCFCAGISDQIKGEVVSLLQISEGSFPIRYLGVPLITKRLTAVDCKMLVSKITARIDSWLVKNLSFAGFLQLISLVIYYLQVYWSRIFIIPKKVIKLNEQKFNRFLWCVQDVKARAKVAWERVCAPKREVGLGIKKLETWNQASMMVHIRNLFAKAGSLWVAWVEIVWLRGKSFWQIPIPHMCSWSWRKILKLRPIARAFLSFKIGAGSRIFLWYDSWHPNGCLENYGFRTSYDAGHNIGPMLSSIIKNGEWHWKSARSKNLVKIQCRLPEISIGNEDTPIWKSNNGKYSCSETWNQLRV
jgi:hypothetical protein